MTKKDFELAVQVIKRTPDETTNIVIEAFVDFFTSENSRFDVNRFRLACIQAKVTRGME